MSKTPQLIDPRKSMLMRQSEVDYVTVSPETGSRQCANCRFFCPSGTYGLDGEQQSASSCLLVEQYPLSILPTGFCNRHEILPDTANEVPPMEVTIVEVEVETETERGYISPLPVRVNALKRLFGAKDPSGLTVFRGADGLRRGLIVVSNGYQDREAEHVATKALEEYVASQFKGEQFAGDNKLLFWHGVDIGDVIAPAVIGGFLVEAVKERGDSPIASLLWDYWEQTSADGSVIWGASHGFKAMREADTYVRIKKYETSVLPIEAAANLYTYSEVLDMGTAFEKHLDTALGLSGAAEILRDKGVNALNEELRKRGKVAKSADKPDAPAVQPGAVIDWTPLLTDLIEAAQEHQKTIDAQDVEIKALKAQAETRQKSADTTVSELDAVKKDLAAQVKRLDTFMADTPRRASEDSRTQLSSEDEATAKAAIEKRTTEYDPAFPGMNVPLKASV